VPVNITSMLIVVVSPGDARREIGSSEGKGANWMVNSVGFPPYGPVGPPLAEELLPSVEPPAVAPEVELEPVVTVWNPLRVTFELVLVRNSEPNSDPHPGSSIGAASPSASRAAATTLRRGRAVAWIPDTVSAP
jgi:hypothetical protein